MNLQSVSFRSNEYLPLKYVYQGENYSPSIEWSEGPVETRSYAVAMYDPDEYGGFLHWMVYNIPPSITSLPEMKNGLDGLPRRAVSTTNDFGEIGYGGPCFTEGKVHHYEISIYALSTTFSLGLTSREVSQYINRYMIAKGKIIALYSR